MTGSASASIRFIKYHSIAQPYGAVGLVSGDETSVVPVAFPSGEIVHDLFDLIEQWDEVGTLLLPSTPTEKLASVTVEAPLTGRDILAVGKNYKAHAKEFQQSGFDSLDKNEQPDFPVIFTKRATSIVPTGHKIYPHPDVTKTLDYEGELGIIVGRRGLGIKKEEAWDYVWGACIINDVTARERQRDHKQFYIGKSLDTFCPMGPYAVHASSINWDQLVLETRVNGAIVQSQNTKDLIFDIPTLIETCSMGITLMPGDVIATGTPAGVGIGKNPPKFLNEGDQLEVTITGLGSLRNAIGSCKDTPPVCAPLRNPFPTKLANDNARLRLPSGHLLHCETTPTAHGALTNGHTKVKPAIIFVHGLGGRSSNYDALIQAAELKHTHQVIKFDLEGHGLSPLRSPSLSIDQFADSVKAILDSQDIRHASVVGHSMGGLVATTLAAKYPSLVANLFLIGPVKQFAEAGVKALSARAQTVRDGGMIAIADAVATAGTSAKTQSSKVLALAAVRDSVLMSPAEGYAQACLALAHAKDPDYKAITAATWILAGTEDKTAPAATIDFLHASIKNSKVVSLNNVGHWHLVEDVDNVARHLRTALGTSAVLE